ncbi:2-hydroxyacid dehydrogenase, partial [Frigidibacter albus]|nr:2-hydroxyacid dehydrogenase [Frigidibacter albus]
MKPDLLVAYPTRPRQMALLAEAYTIHRLDLAEDKVAMLVEVGPRCTAMLCNGHVTIDEAFLAQVPNLRIAASSSVGYDTIDVPALTRAGVRLTNTPDVLTDDVADTA